MPHTATKIRVKGIPPYPGLALGRPCFYQGISHRVDPVDGRAVPRVERLHEALAWLAQRLTTLARKADEQLGSEAGDIFRAHRVILGDPALPQRLFEAVDEGGVDPERAVERDLVSDKHASEERWRC